MIRGTRITLGEKAYLLPPLNAAALELYAEFIQKTLSQGLAEEDAIRSATIIAELVHLALKRNYPDLDVVEVKNHIDLGNMGEMMGCLFKTSGFVATAGE